MLSYVFQNIRYGLIICFACLSLQANAWIDQSQAGAQIASIQGTFKVSNLESVAELILSCQPHAQGQLTWRMRVNASQALLAWGVDDFVVFAMPVPRQYSAHLALEGGLLNTRFSATADGSWQNAQSFVFEFSAPAQATSNLALLADSIGPQSQNLKLKITNGRDPGRVLEAQFSVADEQRRVRETMLGCGPAPKISEKNQAQWPKKNVAFLLDQYPIRWRLTHLLGADYSGLAKQLLTADRVYSDAGFIYVLAPGANARSGIALLLDQGQHIWVVTIDDGKVTQQASTDAGVDMPKALRDFVAIRLQSAP